MTDSYENWNELQSLEVLALKGRVFDLVSRVSRDWQRVPSDDPSILEVIPRLAALMQARPELRSYSEVFAALARSVGLWNYIDKENADVRDEILAEAVTVPALDNIVLHKEQVDALNLLLSGHNLILSAPTSFGKSLLIDAMLASDKYDRVAIVVPTIALLDEFRRRLTRRFGSNFQIVMYPTDEIEADRVIFLGTQERLINRTDFGRLDLVVVDEFYKLDTSRNDDRCLVLNAAVYQLLARSRQFFFLGPNIESVYFTSDNRWKFHFLRTRFSTVAVDLIDLRHVSNKEATLEREVRNPSNWPALVFVSSPQRANQLALEMAKGDTVGDGSAFAAWIEANFGKGWDLTDAIQHGIGLHHGQIPRAIASHVVRLFNSGSLPILLCTSTLIEGVNTAAKSVFIYDKKIARKTYDFFTFSNIRGRAGRLGEHQVGRVYLFHAPPEPDTVEVQPALFGNLEEAPNDLIVHLSDYDRSSRINVRIDAMASSLGLTREELRTASTVGLDVAAELKRHVTAASMSGKPIHWTGLPKYEEILASIEVVCNARSASEFGAASASQLAFFLNSLRSARTMRAFFHSYAESYRGRPEGRGGIFKFLRACEYGLPQILSLMQVFAKQLAPQTNYELFLAELPRWFRAEVLKHLDEQGIPIQVAERFYQKDDTVETLSRRMVHTALREQDTLTEFERRWVISAATFPEPGLPRPA